MVHVRKLLCRPRAIHDRRRDVEKVVRPREADADCQRPPQRRELLLATARCRPRRERHLRDRGVHDDPRNPVRLSAAVSEMKSATDGAPMHTDKKWKRVAWCI